MRIYLIIILRYY